MGKKTLAFVGAGVAVLLLLGLTLGLKGWDSTELVGEALARIEKEAGWTLEAESARLVPLRGVELRGVTGTIRLGAGVGEVSADSVMLEHRPGALLGGRLELERMTLVRPRLALSEPAPPEPRPQPATPPPSPPPKPAQPQAPPPEPPPAPVYEGPVGFHLNAVEIVDGSLAVATAGAAEGLRVEGLNLVLEGPAVASEDRRSLARALSADGRFDLREAELPVGRLSGVSGELRIEDGRLKVPELLFGNGLGDFRAALDLQLGTAPLSYSVTLHGEPIDLQALFDSPEREVFGEAALDVNARGRGTSREGLSGGGQLNVKAGRLPSFPILDHLEAGLRRVSLRNAAHGPVSARFTIDDGALELAPFSVRAAELTILGSGRVGLDGGLDLELELSSTPEAVSLRGVPDDLVELMTVEGGRLSIPVLVTGDTERPRARADAAKLAQRSRERGRPMDEAQLRSRLDELFGLQG